MKNKSGLALFLLTTGVSLVIYQHATLAAFLADKPHEILSPLGSIPKMEAVYAKEPAPTADNRVARLQALFAEYNSPLYPYAEDFIEVADDFGIDWRLLPAIAGAESTFGKHTPSCAPFNPFGWTSSNSPCNHYCFKSFTHAIWYVASKIEDLPYYSDFRASGEVKDIAKSYNQVNTAEWIKNVTFFINKLD